MPSLIHSLGFRSDGTSLLSLVLGLKSKGGDDGYPRIGSSLDGSATCQTGFKSQAVSALCGSMAKSASRTTHGWLRVV